MKKARIANHHNLKTKFYSRQFVLITKKKQLKEAVEDKYKKNIVAKPHYSLLF
jgi:hypothetical protein